MFALEMNLMQYVARQAILDADRSLIAYELLFRDSTENRCPPGDPDIASRKTIDTAVLMGLETLSDGHRIFLNCTENLLLDGLPTLFPPEVTVVEVLESVRPTRQLVDACHKLKEGGYRIALDDFIEQPGYEPLIELADVIKIDVRLTPVEHWPALAAKYLRGRQLLAEKVEREEEFACAKAIGFSLFQGYLFSRPSILSTSSIDGLDANHVRILRTLASPQLNLLEVESIIKSDPALCYRLLRFLNSPAFYLQDEIRSVLHALELLGEVEIRKWMLLVCALGAGAAASKKPLLEMALIRARFAESLAPKMGLSSSELFLLGILSLMHAILDLSVESLVELVAVSRDIRAALLGTSNTLRNGFDLVLAYEAADWNSCEEIRNKWQIPARFISDSYLEAIHWARQLTEHI
jgi:EAL and modified HD-GYP domain-containing signal transduction protein